MEKLYRLRMRAGYWMVLLVSLARRACETVERWLLTDLTKRAGSQNRER